MPAKSLRIAWLGPAPDEDGSAAGVGTELLHGLSMLGHRIDCFFPAERRKIPERLAVDQNITFIWGTSGWQWDRWYSRSRVVAFATGLLARGIASLRLRSEIGRRHHREPYDVIYQNSSIESLGVPSRVTRKVPLVIRPDTHIGGELRFLLAERRLALRSQTRVTFVAVAMMLSVRTLVQRRRIHRATLLICISTVFRDHLVHDYHFPLKSTVVVPNPVRLERFTNTLDRAPGNPPTVLVLGRVAVRKGIEDIVAVARLLLDRKVDVRIRVVGGPSLWSDYRKVLEDLPSENAEYAGGVPASQIPDELARSDILVQASRYEPFALTVAEALAAGVPVVATTEVGAIEDVDRSVVAEFAPGDIGAMATAITTMLDRLTKNPAGTRSIARAEAERLFAPPVVCEKISTALEQVVDSAEQVVDSAGPARP